jgi:hypothetical protein
MASSTNPATEEAHQMLSTKIRTIIVALVTTAALLPASSIASAAVVQRVGAIAQPQQPTVVVATGKSVGSAGIKGWDNLRCENSQYYAEALEREAEEASQAGNKKRAESCTAAANMMWEVIGNHCLVID